MEETLHRYFHESTDNLMEVVWKDNEIILRETNWNNEIISEKVLKVLN